MQRVAEQPDLYPSMHRNTRRALTHRFPFGVFFRVETDSLIVIAAMHDSRDPGRWKKRA